MNPTIEEQLVALGCPVCQSPLEFGKQERLYRFVDLTDIEGGWQDGKDTSEDGEFCCSKNHRHNINSALPDDATLSKMRDYLFGL